MLKKIKGWKNVNNRNDFNNVDNFNINSKIIFGVKKIN